MDTDATMQEELRYLKTTLQVIIKTLKPEIDELAEKREELVASWRDMWENTVPFSNDFERLTEISQFLSGVSTEALNVERSEELIKRYRRLLDSPYFGRFDFTEEGFPEPEKIYVGRHTVMDKDSRQVYVYDWRSPIAGIYYRYELGEAEYQSPSGTVRGTVSLKRQYKIKDSKLLYYFDASVRITDGILHEILGRNSSPQMRAIVETIQKEQDVIIRDTESELLIVQGVAGSGKTSIALHRVAYLLYEGLNLGLKSNNVLILSPNDVFNNYISSVLPELGEENVRQMTIDDIYQLLLGRRFRFETRASQLERIVTAFDRPHLAQPAISSLEFKSSKTFLEILRRYIDFYARHLIEFEDVYYNRELIDSAEALKERFLDNPADIPMAKQLERIEKTLWQATHPLQRKRRAELEQEVASMEGHELEIIPYSRLLAIKEAQALRRQLEKFTKVDYFAMYRRLFTDRELFYTLAEGLTLPPDIETILTSTGEKLQGLSDLQQAEHGRQGELSSILESMAEMLPFEDCAPLLYLKLRVEGSHAFSAIRQVVIDEAQDYNPIHYEIFRLLFREANYTVLGDAQQTIDLQSNRYFYDEAAEILNKAKVNKLFLNRGFRSTCEINRFSQRLLTERQDSLSFERHGEEPRLEQKNTAQDIDQAVLDDIDFYLNRGYETVAVICKTMDEARQVHARLSARRPLKLIDPENGRLTKGALIIPSYLAKGLEFDVVIVYDGGTNRYRTEFDRRLLYIVCTRALHQLVVYHTGSCLLSEDPNDPNQTIVNRA